MTLTSQELLTKAHGILALVREEICNDKHGLYVSPESVHDPDAVQLAWNAREQRRSEYFTQMNRIINAIYAHHGHIDTLYMLNVELEAMQMNLHRLFV